MNDLGYFWAHDRPNDRDGSVCTSSTIRKAWTTMRLFATDSSQIWAEHYFSREIVATNLIPWNFSFPTRAELLLWHVSASIFTGVIGFFWDFETIAARQRFGRWDKYLIWLSLKKPPPSSTSDEDVSPKRQDTINRLDAFEQEQKRAKPILAWEIGLLLPIVLLYVVARAYMVVEVFVSLREVPTGVYRTFEVTELLPHW
ncbi:hypothetical protein CC78DRAFT_580445 [Lojkania enalia]|uniref:Uncharacterized protein n=1 Tax=Lojkania enalia TaxID=147567 RepID=A0A9P4K939_9PLEO|nr:hypothetical protein CC78DRAFT_580445 [Didymosphaeria enalia]